MPLSDAPEPTPRIAAARPDAAAMRFGAFELDPAGRRLLHQGQPVELGTRAFDLLQVLAGAAGRLVGKDELLDRVWPDTVVEEANLHVQMTALRKVIGRDAVATVPGRGYQFVWPVTLTTAAGAAPVPGPAASPAAPAAGLPPLLGREAELAGLLHALQHPAAEGWINLTGAGGSGKTLLARHVAAHLVAAHGAASLAWVDLVELSAPEAVVPAVAAAVGAHGPPRSADALAQALADARLWLVLDNAEHLLEAVGTLVDALQRGAPGVRLLVTSQAPLRRAGERLHPLGGLAVPALPCTAEQALRHAAVAHFVAHARQADRRWRFGEAEVEPVVAICSSLDGSALGVQLAAALLGPMPLAAVRSRLARAERSPGAGAIEPAANVLRSALSWSHALLTPAAQRVFRRLAVAQGPLPLALVRALARPAADTPALDAEAEAEADDASDAALADLVARSLVQCETAAGGPPRYRLLEAPRALALEHLQAAGESADALWGLARGLLPLGDAMHAIEHAGQIDTEGEAALQRQAPAPPDLVAAFEAAATRDEPAAAAALIRLQPVLLRGAVLAHPAADRLRWAAQVRARANTPGLAPSMRARALEGAAALIRHSDMAARREVLSQAAESWREAGDVYGEFRSLSRLADTFAMAGQHLEAAGILARVRALEDPAWPPGRRRWRWFAEGVAAVTAGDLPRAMAAWRQQLELVQEWAGERVQALHSLANAEQIAGETAAALPRLLEAAAIARQIRMRATLLSYVLPNLLAAQLALGDTAAARASAAEGWSHALVMDAEGWWADHLALLAAREGRPRTAARLLGLADAAYGRLDDARQALEVRAVGAAEASARAALGDAAFDALRGESRSAAAADPAGALAARVRADALAAVDGAPPDLAGSG